MMPVFDLRLLDFPRVDYTAHVPGTPKAPQHPARHWLGKLVQRALARQPGIFRPVKRQATSF